MWHCFIHLYFIGSIIALLIGLVDAYVESKLGQDLDNFDGGIVTAMGCSWVYILCSYKRIYKNILILRHRNKSKKYVDSLS